MSQPDFLTQLRKARPTAPAELRERVRLVASRAPQPRRRLSWRLGAVLAFAAALAIVAAIVATRGEEQSPSATPRDSAPAEAKRASGAPTQTGSRQATPVRATGLRLPTPTASRVQRYRAYLELRLASSAAVSGATQRALSITRSLGGYPLRIDVDARGRTGDGTLRLRVPRTKVQAAVTRLSALGTIVASNVSIEDLQAQVGGKNRLMDRLQRRLRVLRAHEQTDDVKRRIASLTKRIETLQRQQAATLRDARYATVDLHLTTQKAAATPVTDKHGPLHGLGVAFRWVGIVTVYALALAAPFVVLGVLAWLAARTIRRRREDALLSSP
jgi:Domain of unknown function (DUF4349)